MTMACNNCLQEILAGESFWEDETEGTAYHEDCRQAALDRRNKAEEERADASARAAAAEAEVARLRDENAEAWHAFDRQQSRGDRLAARVAELEAQAAQGWRPVTAEWPPYGVQHLGRAMLNSPTLLVTRVLFESDMRWVWQDNDGILLYGGDIRYCAAIPTATATEDKV